MRKLAFLFFLSSVTASAQYEDVDAVAGDLIFLSQMYVTPAANAAVYQSSGGWCTSAKKKDLWNLEISIQGNMLFIPNKSTNFRIDESQLSNLVIKGDATSALSPTALGGDNNLVLEGNIGGELFEFDSPEGINESYVNHFQIQAALGLWKGTSIIGRFSPKIKINKTYYQIVGGGFQHNISQWIPSLEKSKYDIAALATYSRYAVSDDFTPVSLSGMGSLTSITVNGQSFMFNLVGSREFNRFNVILAAGISSSDFQYGVGGDESFLLDVLNSSLEGLDESQINFKGDIGVGYFFKNFSINTMLTFGEYANLVFGINYSI
ncbi:DUF6588 family protein [Mangrovimonas aestuarii]|uniref:DUF6588 family protein n=1 Tax=Mangrovimonas aestuarii TaxID=3018443 RepID=UPI0023797E69|nr:DUF6588 family protein [Mangrovimonas aestuarii]